jgi:hypothetical protein
LIDGIAGFADADSSGFVSLAELSKYALTNIQKNRCNKQHTASFIYSAEKTLKYHRLYRRRS